MERRYLEPLARGIVAEKTASAESHILYLNDLLQERKSLPHLLNRIGTS
jgi:hypothetical protein